MRGITSSVNIQWITVYNYSYTIVRRVDNVTVIIDNSTTYTEQLVTPPLNVNDDGRLYYCEVNINTTFGISSYGIFVLNFTGK